MKFMLTPMLLAWLAAGCEVPGTDTGREDRDQDREGQRREREHQDAAQRQQDEMRRQMDHLRQQVDEERRHGEEARRQLDQTKRKLEEASHQATRSQQELHQLQQQLARTKAEVEAARQRTEAQVAEAAAIRRKAEAAGSELERARRDAMQAKERSTELERKLDAAKSKEVTPPRAFAMPTPGIALPTAPPPAAQPVQVHHGSEIHIHGGTVHIHMDGAAGVPPKLQLQDGAKVVTPPPGLKAPAPLRVEGQPIQGGAPARDAERKKITLSPPTRVLDLHDVTETTNPGTFVALTRQQVPVTLRKVGKQEDEEDDQDEGDDEDAKAKASKPTDAKPPVEVRKADVRKRIRLF